MADTKAKRGKAPGQNGKGKTTGGRESSNSSHSPEPSPPDRSRDGLPGKGKWLVLLTVGTGTFMSALDGSVVNVILPVVSRAFHTSVASVEWVVTVYLLVVSGVLLSFGRLGDMRGHKPIYSLGFIIFVISSALCGFAPSNTLLVAGRGLQAIGAAMLFANAPAILTLSFPAEQRGQALGLMGMMTYLGLTTGPTLGGWLAGALGWRAVFFINVPVGALAFFLCRRFVPVDHPADQCAPFDIPGAATFMLGMTALLLGLNQGHTWGWTSAPILGLLAVAVIILGVFLRLEARSKSPMLDLRLFSVKLFSASTGSAILNYMAVSGAVFLLPFYLIQGRGLHPLQAGLLLSAQSVVMAVTAPLSGSLSDRVGSRAPATIGMGILAGGLFFLSRLSPTTPLSHAVIALGLMGLGSGLFVSPNNNALMGAAPREQQGIAGGVLAAARNVGMVLGVGFAGAIFTTILAGRAGAPGPLTHALDCSLLGAMALAILGAVTSFIR